MREGKELTNNSLADGVAQNILQEDLENTTDLLCEHVSSRQSNG